jgi:imidazolonepropionase-like amidohydrolase
MEARMKGLVRFGRLALLLLAATACRARDGGPHDGPGPAAPASAATPDAPAGRASVAPLNAPDAPAGAAPDAAPSSPAPVTALVGAVVWDGTGRPPLPDAVVLLREDRIAAVGSRADVPVPADARIIDAAGKWIIPGLIDAHVHFFQSGGLYTRPDVVDLRAVRPYAVELEAIHAGLDDAFRRVLASGVTAVVDLGGPFWNFDVRDRAGDEPFAPRVAVAGPLISTVDDPPLDLGDPPIVKAASPDDARALVRRQLERRPDFIKLWFIVDAEHPVEAGAPMIRAAIKEAHAAGVRVFVHATELEAARAAVDAGADVLVHSVHDRVADPAFVELLRSRGTILIPNLVVLEGYAEVLTGETVLTDVERRLGDPEVIGSWAEFALVADDAAREKGRARRDKYLVRAPIMRQNLALLRAAGITLAAGTDAGNIGTLHGPSLHRELELLAEAGMTAEEVLLAATRSAARVFAAQPDFGTLEPGKLADLLVLDADPLADVRNARRIALVVHRGIVSAPGDLHASNPEWVVQEQLDAYNARDLERFVATYAPDAVLATHPGEPDELRGVDALRETYGRLFAANPELRCRLLGRAVFGRFVVDHELVTGIEGRPYLHGVATYEVDGGLIRRVWFLPRD